MSKTRIKKKADGTILVERFTPFRRLEHIAVIVVFVLLVMTGFPQKFYEAGWASDLLKWFGGLDRARTIHRIVGLVMVGQTFMHIALIVVGVLMRKMRLTLLPTPQDLRDVFTTLAYYFGYRKEHPVYPKFDYRQKFEYIGMVLGGLVMVFSGLILLFPGEVTMLLPGQLIPAARLAHSSEALLALSVLIIWHVYGAHLSPDVFPMDTSVFTGYMKASELKKHHYLEWKRIFPAEAKAHEEELARAEAQAKAPS